MGFGHDLRIDGAFLFGVSFLVLLLGITLWSRRRPFGPGHRYFLLTHVGVSGWLLCTILQVGTDDIPTKVLWNTMTLPMITLSSTAWSLFLIEFGPIQVRGVRKCACFATAMPTAVMICLALTNPWHQSLIGLNTEVAMLDGRVSIIPDRQWMFYLMLAHNFGWVTLAGIVSIYGYTRATNAFKPLYGNLLAMSMVPVLTNLSFLLFGFTIAGVDPTPYALLISVFAYRWALVNSRLLSVEVVGERHLFREASLPKLICNRKGKLVSINPCAEAMFSGPGAAEMTELIDGLIAALMAGDRIDPLYHYVVAGRAYRVDALIVDDVIHPDRESLGWTLSLIDVSQEEETARGLLAAKEQAEEAMRIHAELVSVISHELRTPVTSISGTLDLMAAGAFGALPDKAQHGISIAKRNSKRLRRLIEDLLDLQKLEAGQFKVTFEDVALAANLRAAAEDLSGYGAMRNVRVVLEEPCIESFCRTDPERLEQVIANVVSNAVKFSDEDDVVRISTVEENGFAEIRIADNGPGIPEGSEDKVFGRFTQLDGSSTRAYEGTGLGMTIARLMIEHMGGEIFYRSEVGVGTTFYLRVPLSEASEIEAAA